MMIKTGSDFSGVGAFDQALSRLGITQKKMFACDMDKYARQTYIYNFGNENDIYLSSIDILGKTTVKATDYSFYYPKDVYDREIPSDSLDIYMTSPPCQSFSLAGKRKGEDSTNGVLFYNSHEFIVKNNPRYFIFENVKGLLSDNGGKTFKTWIDMLGGKTVNGNPVIFPHEESVADNEFSFPKPFHLVKRLKDVLENEVDEKYFLSDKMIEGFIKHGVRHDERGNGFAFSPSNINKEARSVTTASGTRNTDNYIEIGKIGYVNQDTQASQVYSEDGITPNICAGTHGYANGYVETKIAAIRGRNIDGGKIEQQLEVNESGLCNSLTTVQKDNVVVIKFERTEEAKKKRKESLATTGKDTGSFSDRQMIGVEQDFSDTILANANPQKEGLIIIPANNSKGYDIAEEEEEDSINFSNPNSETRRGRVGHGVSQTLDTACNQGILTQRRIRRLTPTEAFRLMDFNENFKWNVSDSQAYKQAGNSIVVSCLVEIISRLKL
jgi:DNA (cytosine-5)-methyltransferase 1